MPFDGLEVGAVVSLMERARGLIGESWRWKQGSEGWWGRGGGPMCLVGALSRASGELGIGVPEARLALVGAHGVLRRIGGMELPEFNDTHTHGEVLGLIDLAIGSLLGESVV